MRYSVPALLAALLLVLAVPAAQAQYEQYNMPWMGKAYLQAEDPDNPTFFEIQDAFYRYWANREPQKGKGYKQWKRLEWYWEPRVGDDGLFPPPNKLWKEYAAYQRRRGEAVGAFRSGKTANTGAGDWEHLGPVALPNNGTGGGSPAGLGRINAIAFDPTDSSILYIGAASGGLWKSTTGGANWFTTTDDWPFLGITDIAVHPKNPDTLFVATGDGNGSDTWSVGILRSNDGGATWVQTGLNYDVVDNRLVHRVLINPSNPNIMLAGGSQGIFRSTDGGASWTVRRTGNFRDLEFRPGDPTTVYAGSSNEIAVSTDGGLTWSAAAGIPSSGIRRIELAVTPANPDVVHAVAGANNNGFYGFYTSTNRGQNFNQRSNSPNILGWQADGSDAGGQAWYDLCIEADPNNADQVYVGGVNLWGSSNGGRNWNCVAHWFGQTGLPAVHADHHTLAWSPHTGALYSGNDGGIYRTFNGGASWSDVSSGLAITQFYKLGGSPTARSVIFCGAQDNGTNKWGDPVWERTVGGDGMEQVVDPLDSNVVYSTIQFGDFRKSVDGGQTYTNIVNSINDSGAWVTPFLVHPTQPDTLFIGYRNVHRSYDGGSNWTNVTGFSSGPQYTILELCESQPDVIYLGHRSRRLHRSTDGGDTWVDISSQVPNIRESLTSLEVNPNNPNELWITFSGFRAGDKIFHSTDGGQNWTNISGSLPNLPANHVVFEIGSNNALYLAMDVGVYYRDDNTGDWEPFMNGLPNVIVSELEIFYPDRKIRAATYGRGLWESDLFSIPVECLQGVGAQLISRGPDVLSTARTTANPLALHPDSGLAVFAHRRNATGPGAHTGQLLLDYSTDGGRTWTTGAELLNPSANAGNQAAVFPQTALLGDSSGLHAAWLANHLSAGGQLAGWSAGLAAVDTGAQTETYNPGPNLAERNLIRGLTRRAATNELFAVDFVDSIAADTGGFRIHWARQIGDSLVWEAPDTLAWPANTQFNGAPLLQNFQLAFSPNGQFAWLAGVGHPAAAPNARRLYPFAYYSVDSGRNWQGPLVLDLDTLEAARGLVGQAGGSVTATTGLNLTVDSTGQAYAFVSVARTTGAPYGYEPGSAQFLSLQPTLAGAWTGASVAAPAASLADLDTTPGGVLLHDHQLHLARNAAGTVLFYAWTDSDTGETGGPHTAPNLFVRAYDIAQDQWTSINQYTGCNGVAPGEVYFPKMPRQVAYDGVNYTLPVVYTRLNPSSWPYDSVEYVALSGVSFSGCDFGEVPQLQITGNLDLCPGQTVTLTAPSGYASYNWSTGNSGLTAVVDTSGEYFVDLATSTGCLVRSEPVEVQYRPVPDFALLQQDSVGFCPGAKVTLNAPSGFADFRWSTGDTNFTIVVDRPGPVYLEVTNAAGCTGSSDTVQVFRKPEPQVPQLDRQDNTVFITNAENVDYTWFLDGQVATNVSDTFYSPIRDGQLFVTAALAGCRVYSDTVYFAYSTNTSRPENPLAPLQLFPNPSPGLATLAGELPTLPNLQLRVYSLQGQLLYTEHLAHPGGDFRLGLDLRPYSAGLYLVELASGDYRHTWRLQTTQR